MPRLTIPFNHELEMTDYYLFVLPTVKLLSLIEMAFCVCVLKKTVLLQGNSALCRLSLTLRQLLIETAVL